MTGKKLREKFGNKAIYDLHDLFEMQKEELEQDFAKHNKSMLSYGVKRKMFIRVIKTYFRFVINDALYKYRKVNLGYRVGTVIGVKKLAVEFNARHLDKTGGYFYYLYFKLNKTLSKKYKIELLRYKKQELYRHIVNDGGDFPEICWQTNELK